MAKIRPVAPRGSLPFRVDDPNLERNFQDIMRQIRSLQDDLPQLISAKQLWQAHPDDATKWQLQLTWSPNRAVYSVVVEVSYKDSAGVNQTLAQTTSKLKAHSFATQFDGAERDFVVTFTPYSEPEANNDGSPAVTLTAGQLADRQFKLKFDGAEALDTADSTPRFSKPQWVSGLRTADFSVFVEDPAGRGGSLKLWTNQGNDASADPTLAAQHTITVASSGTQVGPSTLATDGVTYPLNDIEYGQNKGKQIYLEFVTEDGRTTGVQAFPVESLLDTVDPDGRLKDIFSYAQTLRPYRVVSTRPASGDAEGDRVFALDTKRAWTWTSGAWAEDAPHTAGNIVYAPVLVTGLVKADHIDANSGNFNKLFVNDKLVAGNISASSLSAITADLGTITAGQVHNGALVGGIATGDAGLAIAAAPNANWNRYVDLSGLGSYFLYGKDGNFRVDHAGNVVIKGTLEAGSTINADIPDARLSSNVPLKNAANQFSNTQHIVTDAGYNGDYALAIKQTADTQWRLFAQNTGVLLWGSGTAGVDTNLYRSAANVLKTDDSFVAGQNLSVGATLDFGSRVGQHLNLYGTTYGLGIEDYTVFFRSERLFRWYLAAADGGASDKMELSATALSLSGVTLDMGNNRITSLADPDEAVATHATNVGWVKGYVTNIASTKTTYSDLWDEMIVTGANMEMRNGTDTAINTATSGTFTSASGAEKIHVYGGIAYVDGRRVITKSATILADNYGAGDYILYFSPPRRGQAAVTDSNAVSGPDSGESTENFYSDVCIVVVGSYTYDAEKHERSIGHCTVDAGDGTVGAQFFSSYKWGEAIAGVTFLDSGGFTRTLHDPYNAKLFAQVAPGYGSRLVVYRGTQSAFYPAISGLKLGSTTGDGLRWGTFYGEAIDITGSATIGGNLALTGTMTSGSVPDARLSGNVPLINAHNTFTGSVRLQTATVTSPFLARVSGDTEYRFAMYTDGKMTWGPGGTVGQDTNLYRSAADTLKTDDTFEANYLRLFGNLVGNVGSGTTYKEFDLIAMHGSVVRWIMRLKGADADGNFSLFRYNDAGAFLGTPLSINRSSGLATFETTPYVGANQIWHKGNDGDGSTLDADLLDGVHGSGFLRRDTANGISSYANTITFPSDGGIEQSTAYKASLQVYNSVAGAGAFMQFHVGSDYAVYFGLDGSTNDLAVGGWSMGAVKYKVWHAGNDGVGSGLNADLLDGLDSGQFLRSDVSDTMTGDLNFGTRTGQRINLWSTTYGLGIQNATHYLRTAANFAVFKEGAHSDTELDPGTGGVLALWTDRFRADALHVRNGMWVHQHTGGSHRDSRINAGLALPGREVNNNPEFHDRLSGYTVYDNNGSGRVLLSLETVADTANSTARRMRINYDPARSATATSPGFGGFTLQIGKAGALAGSSANFRAYRQGNRLVYRLWAWIPSGRLIQWASNGVGPSSGGHWATTQDGKSAWREYVWVQTIGTGGVDGDYGTTGYFYISGGTDTAFDWYLGRCTVTAVDEADGPAYSPGLRVGHYLDQALGDGEIIAGGKIYAQKGLHINTEALWLYDMGGSGYGNLVVQGRVLSGSNNIHLSPPNGTNVVINTDYRAAGGATGTAGLIATGDIQGRSFKATNRFYYGSDNAYLQLDNGGANFLTNTGAALTGRFGNVFIGASYANPAYRLDVKGDIYADGGWFRVSGNQGYYFQTHGGGWYMIDTTWIRAYNNKGIYTQGVIRSESALKVGNDFNAAKPLGTSVVYGKNGQTAISDDAWTASSHIGVNFYFDGSAWRPRYTDRPNAMIRTDANHVNANIATIDFYFGAYGGNPISWQRTAWFEQSGSLANLKVTGEVHGTIFRDYNNTAYYLDPANTTASLLVAGQAKAPTFVGQDDIELRQIVVSTAAPSGTPKVGTLHVQY